MDALYNDVEPFAAAWMRELITAGHIAPGVVDERSISDLTPADVAGPGQRHFFSGIGGWSYALRLAGVPDDADIWTGSCPCQPFSSAGKRGGTSDARHLWPAWFALIRECRPATIFGEQVAGPDGLAWLDGVFADLEGSGYAVGAAVVSAGSASAPHGRHRIYFVAYASGQRREGERLRIQPGRSRQGGSEVGRSGEARAVGDSVRTGRTTGRSITGNGQVAGTDAADRLGYSEGIGRGTRWTPRSHGRAEIEPDGPGAPGALGNSDSKPGGRYTRAVSRTQSADASMRSRVDGSRAAGQDMDPERMEHAAGRSGELGLRQEQRNEEDLGRAPTGTRGQRAAPTGAFDPWRDAVWIDCTDGKRRPIPTEPTLFPLAHGVPGRVGMLRGAGNAIVPQCAASFIRAAQDAREESEG